MSHDIKVENVSGYLGTEYSSGDSNQLKSKQFYQEENNNEVNELSKNLEMGCIVDVVKRPPNICVETCVYEEGESDNNQSENDIEDIHYSDEFEDEDVSETEERKEEPNHKTVLSNNTSRVEINKSHNMKLTKSQSSMSSHKPPSVSGRSSDYGSISVPPTRRVNMSFTNERLREIDRHNHILLNKILSARNKQKSSIPPRDQGMRKPVAPAAVHRKMQQRKIDHDNMILLKKIQRAKSTSCSIRR